MTTEKTPATPAPSSTAFDSAAFRAVAATLLGNFDPGSPTDPGSCSIPSSVATQDGRRVFSLMAAQLYLAAGQKDAALAWRVRHAFEAGVISGPARWRFAAREVSGNEISIAERETRDVLRRMASDRIAERAANAAELTALIATASMLGDGELKKRVVAEIERRAGSIAPALPAPAAQPAAQPAATTPAAQPQPAPQQAAA